jgi:hypothetical protein
MVVHDTSGFPQTSFANAFITSQYTPSFHNEKWWPIWTGARVPW